MSDLNNAYTSGEPNTTGREPFEDSTTGSNAGNIQSGAYNDNLGQGLSGDRQEIGGDRQELGRASDSSYDQGERSFGGAEGDRIPDSGDRRDDRVGDLGQKQPLYERTTDDGPVTAGAPGTDRFDTDKPPRGLEDSDRGFGGKTEEDVDRRGADQDAGGPLGMKDLGTSDKDFVARDRLGKGAYKDEAGNATGPGGNTALTGREGNREENPVAQEKERKGEDVEDVHGQGAEEVAREDHPAQEKKGMMEKIKEKMGK